MVKNGASLARAIFCFLMALILTPYIFGWVAIAYITFCIVGGLLCFIDAFMPTEGETNE